MLQRLEALNLSTLIIMNEGVYLETQKDKDG